MEIYREVLVIRTWVCGLSLYTSQLASALVDVPLTARSVDVRYREANVVLARQCSRAAEAVPEVNPVVGC